MLFNELFIILALLFIKHFLVDFIFQTDEHIKNKGSYGHLKGIEHSLQQGVGTTFVLFPFIGWEVAILLGVIDSIVHYHIDWAKMSINQKWKHEFNSSQFWTWFGADQLAHSLTYIWLVWLLF